MFIKPRFRLVPDNTRIHFMRGRYMGLIVSAVLSIASAIMFFYPGLNLGIDFSGGVVMQIHTEGPADFGQIHAALNAEHVAAQGVQRFGDASEVLIRLGAQSSEAGTQAAVARVRAALEKGVPGARIQRTDAVGASVSAELFRNGLLALGISLLMILVYIWFRFEWQFAVGAVITLVLDITKAIGFLALTRIEFDLVMVAAILTVLGYSTNDKVVVYDRVRENLRKYKSMPLRELIDLSINETLNRTLGTSMTVFLASLPLALFGGESISGFAWVMLFGIVVGTSSSIFIAAPILLFLGEHRLRREAAAPAAPTATKADAAKAGTATAGTAKAAGGAVPPVKNSRGERAWGEGHDGPATVITSRRTLLAGLRRRTLLAGAAAAAGIALRPVRGTAVQPVRPKQHVTLLLGVAAGSGPDKVARTFVGFLVPRLSGIEIELRNVPGDSGRTMLAALGAAAPDGMTLGWVVTPNLPARMIDHSEPSLSQNIRLIGQVEREPVAFVSPSSDPVTSIQDIIQRASDDAGAVPLGTPPAGSAPHLAALRLQVLAQTQLNIVTFPSPAAARQAVLGGNVSVAALGLSEAIGDINAGNLSAIGIAARRRFGLLPDTPVLDEGGIPLAAFVRRGVAVPVGTPAELIGPLAGALRAVTEDDDFREQAEANGYYAAWEEGPVWFDQMQTEQAALTKLWETNPWLSSSGGG